MDIKKFWEARNVICDSYSGWCEGCPLYSHDSYPHCLGSLTHAEKAVPIIEQWLKEHGEAVELPKPKLTSEALADLSKTYANMRATYQSCKGCPIEKEIEKWDATIAADVNSTPRLDPKALAEFSTKFRVMCSSVGPCSECPTEGILCRVRFGNWAAEDCQKAIAAVEEWHNRNRSEQINSIDLLSRFTNAFMEEFDLIPSEARKMTNFIAKNEQLKQYYTMHIQEETK